MDLSFITDQRLRERIEGAIGYVFALYEDSKGGERTFHVAETYRVIILYVASSIEAILFYLYEKRDEKVIRVEYKEVIQLPEAYHHKKVEGRVVLAIAQAKIREEHDIGLRQLVTLFENNGVLLKKTADQILKINNLRNTFHFRKDPSHICTLEDVEHALQLLVYVIEHAPQAIKRAT